MITNIETLKDYRPINSLELETLVNLTRNNLKFRDIVFDAVYDNLIDLLDNDYLYNAPFIYEFGCVYATRVSFNNRYGYGVKWSEIVDYIEKSEREYCFIDISEYKKSALELAKQAQALQEKLDDSDCGYADLSDLNYERIAKRVDQIQNELESRIKNAIDSVLDSADDVDYLIDELEIIRDYAFDNLFIDHAGNIKRVTIESIA